MFSRQLFEDYRSRIRFTDLDLASRAMALFWLDLYRDRVIRNCFPGAASQSLIQELAEIINSAFLEGYVLARAAEGRGTASVKFTDPHRKGSVETGLGKLRRMYEEEAGGEAPFAGTPQGVETLAEALVRETVYGPRLMWLEERELFKVHLMYALWAGYRLAGFERKLSGERG